MKTFRSGDFTSATWPAGVTGDTTTWHYEEATGLLLSKQDAAGEEVAYAYGPGGRLTLRTWARPKSGGGALTTTYDYDEDTGELLTVNYNDSTPDVTYTYDRLGRQPSAVQRYQELRSATEQQR